MVSLANQDWDMSVRELAERSGQSVRTIHYYIAEGLLPPPRGVKRGATYTRAHLARLRLIAALRDEGLALAAIRSRLAPLADEQVVAVVSALDAYLSSGNVRPISTLGMIENAVAHEAHLEERAAPAPRAMSDPVHRVHPGNQDEQSDHGAVRESASDYVSRILGRSSPSRPAQSPPLSRPSPAPIARPAAPEAWYHFPISDGIELRVREDRYHESRGRLRAVIDTIVSSLHRYGLFPPEDRDSTR